MEQGFAILMFLFAGALLLYAALLAVTKNYHLLPYRATVSVKPKNPKKYTLQLAKTIALAAAGIALGAAVALRYPAVGAVVIVAGVAAACWAGTKIVKNE